MSAQLPHVPHASYEGAAERLAQLKQAGRARHAEPRDLLAVAAGWQSPGHTGRVLASLASGVAVDVEALQDDVDRTLIHDRPAERDGLALLAVADWARHHESERDGATHHLVTMPSGFQVCTYCGRTAMTTDTYCSEAPA